MGRRGLKKGSTWNTGSALIASGIAASVGATLGFSASSPALLSTISKNTFLTTGA